MGRLAYVTSPSRPPLSKLDAELARLRSARPDWNIWFVPHADGHVVWCAQPYPLLNCSSPQELTEAMDRAVELGGLG